MSIALPGPPLSEELARLLFPAQPEVIPFDGLDAAMLLALSTAITAPWLAASLVSLSTVERYLTERGWTRGECPRWAMGRGRAWHAPPRYEGDPDYCVILPAPDVRNFAGVLTDAAHGVGVHEDRATAQVLAAWLLAQHETGAYRVAPETP